MSNQLRTQQYSLEWNDHLHEIYADFGRRCNLEEWAYFLNRPEMANPKTAEEIGATILGYILEVGHISQQVLKAIEETFNFIENRKVYEKYHSIRSLEIYKQFIAKEPEFPPFAHFETLEDDKAYDEYIDMFQDLFFLDSYENPEEFHQALEELEKFQIKHKYESFLKAKLFAMAGSYKEAAQWISEAPDGYYKYMTMGSLLLEMSMFKDAEEYFEQAIKMCPGRLDYPVIEGYIVSMANNGKKEEALKGLRYLSRNGYEVAVKAVRENLGIDETEDPNWEGSVEYRYNLAKAYMSEGQYNKALEILFEINVLEPQEEKYLYDIALCYREKGEHDDSCGYFNILCDINPAYKDAAFQAIEESTMVEDHEDKLEDAKELLKKYKEYLTEYQVKYFEGEFAEMNGEFAKAKKIYEILMEAYQGGEYPEEMLHDVFLRYCIMWEESNARVGELEKAITKFLEKHPTAVDVWYYLANMYFETEYKTDEAAKCFEKILELKPHDRETAVGLIKHYTEQEQSKKAYEVSKKLTAFSEDPDDFIVKVYLDMELCKFKEAAEDMERYVELGGDEGEIAEMKATVAMHTGNYEKAEELLRYRIENRKPSEIPCYHDLAICLCKQGKADEAEELMEIACENSEEHDYHMTLFNIQLHNGKLDQAKKTLKRYRKQLKISRFDEGYALLSSLISLEQGKIKKAYLPTSSMIEPDGERMCAIFEALFFDDYEESVKLLNSAVKNAEDDVENYTWLSFVHYLNGNMAAAAKEAGRGIELLESIYDEGSIGMNPCRLTQYSFLNLIKGNVETAEEGLKKAIELPTCTEYVCRNCYEAYSGLGILYSIQGRKEDATKAFEKAYEEKSCNMICRQIQSMMDM